MADKPRLLLVDDDTVTLQVLSKTLAPYARMRFARSGAEALKAGRPPSSIPVPCTETVLGRGWDSPSTNCSASFCPVRMAVASALM